MKFNSHASGFDLDNARYLARVSNLVYLDFPSGECEGECIQKMSELGFESSNIQFFESKDTEALLACDEEKIIIVFRGTEQDSMEDWSAGARINKTTCAYGDVHSGFMEAINHIWIALEAALQECYDGKKTVWLTGHSLGAALATLAFALLQSKEQPIAVNGLYTFGSPRLCGSDFAELFDSRHKKVTCRFVNNNDIVTKVPPNISYSHIGRLMYFDSDGQLHSDKVPGWWEIFWDRLSGAMENLLHSQTLDGIADHSMDVYEDLLRRQS